MRLLSAHWPVDTSLGRACAAWPGDLGPSAVSMPLRIAGGLHALVLGGDALAAVYPPHEADDDALLAAVLEAMVRHEAFLQRWIESAPQTNEVRRSAVLIPAAHWIARRFALPFMVSELGASAGLNLNWDRFAVQAGEVRLGPGDAVLTLEPEWSGAVPVPAAVEVVDRAGVDLNPLPVGDVRLFAYLWPDQPHRAALTRAAMAVQEASVVRGDAVDWLGPRLAAQPEGVVHLIQHTVAWQYFPAAKQAEGRARIEAAGAQATERRPLAWLGLEADGGGEGAGITLRLWPGDERIALGRADFHGRWVRWAG